MSEPGRPAVDVAVIGAGLTGLAIAREAARAGARVVVFEAEGLPRRPFEAGWVTAQCDADEHDATSSLRLAGRSLFFDWVAAVESESGHRIPRREGGTLVPALTLPELEVVHDRASWQRHRRLGFETLTGGSTRDRQPGLADELVAALHLREDRAVDADALHAALLVSAAAAGVELHLASPVFRLVTQGRAVSGVQVNEGHILAGVTVIAAGVSSGGFGLPPVPIVPKRELVAVLGLGRAFTHGLWHDRFRVSPLPDGRVFITGPLEAVGFDRRVPAGRLAKLLNETFHLAPSLGDLPLLTAGCVLRATTPDGRPMLGSTDAQSLIYATGFADHGLPLAPIAAKLIVEYMQTGNPSLDWSAFDPRRFSQ